MFVPQERYDVDAAHCAVPPDATPTEQSCCCRRRRVILASRRASEVRSRLGLRPLLRGRSALERRASGPDRFHTGEPRQARTEGVQHPPPMGYAPPLVPGCIDVRRRETEREIHLPRAVPPRRMRQLLLSPLPSGGGSLHGHVRRVLPRVDTRKNRVRFLDRSRIVVRALPLVVEGRRPLRLLRGDAVGHSNDGDRIGEVPLGARFGQRSGRDAPDVFVRVDEIRSR
mmetsp:Transcript_51143/g.153660  ORF Transcript_51143/g.153660 Transcript_51143/m.153660 type:complete len:227 (+) Transcript_51143:365-1045(+)